MKDNTGKIKYIIFDFDGTIARSFPLIIKIYNRSYAKKYKLPTVKDPEKIRDVSLNDLKNMTHLSIFRLFFAMRKIKKQFGKDIDDLEIEHGMLEVIKILSEKYRLGIISTNSEKNIAYFLKKYKIEDKFEFVYAADTFSQKYGVLKKAMKKFKLNKENMIYIGDEVQDIVAAKKLGLKLITVPWGMNSEKLLIKERPDFIVKKPKDLLRIIDTLK